MAERTLPKQARLLKRADFSAIFANQRKAHSEHFLMLAKTNSLDYARFGLAVAKKHLKRAVMRNTVKRIARESFRYSRQQLPNLDVVLLTKRSITQPWPTLTKKQLRNEIDKLFNKLRVK